MTVHIMFDLETWGTKPGCDIRSIGACVFDPVTGVTHSAPAPHDPPGTQCFFTDGDSAAPLPSGASHTFYVATDNPVISDDIGEGLANNSYKYPLHRDPRTVQWWAEQSDEAQAAFADPVDLREALLRFGDWLTALHNDPTMHYSAGFNAAYHPQCATVRLWSHGAAADPGWLAAAYDAVGLPVPWHYRAPRDTRTLFDIAGIEDHSAWLAAHPGPLGVAHHALDDSICQARAVCAAWDRAMRICHPGDTWKPER